MPLRACRYSGSERPACRMNHTGVWLTGSPRQAARNGASGSGVTSESSQTECDEQVPAATGRRRDRVRQRPQRRLLGVALVDGSGSGASPGAERFERIAETLRHTPTRAEVSLDQVPAPTRLATFGVALSAEVLDGEDQIGSGRLVLLHEPGGHEAWDGEFRCVTFVRATVETDVAADPMLPGVGWSWLIESLDGQPIDYTAVGGTVTSVTNESFGSMADQPGGAEVEIRASWTPLLPLSGDTEAHARGHAQAWLDLMCTAAGLEPLPDGVVALPRQRSRG